MKALPVTFGLPAELDVLVEEFSSSGRVELVAQSRQAINGLLQYLGWLLTSPMPHEEYVVALSLSEACEAALNILDSEPTWGGLLKQVEPKSEE